MAARPGAQNHASPIDSVHPRAHSPGGDTDQIDAALLDRFRAEFGEMRGFSPTLTQAARLFHVSADECERVLDVLVRQGFLHRDTDGTYRLISQ